MNFSLKVLTKIGSFMRVSTVDTILGEQEKSSHC